MKCIESKPDNVSFLDEDGLIARAEVSAASAPDCIPQRHACVGSGSEIESKSLANYVLEVFEALKIFECQAHHSVACRQDFLAGFEVDSVISRKIEEDVGQSHTKSFIGW